MRARLSVLSATAFGLLIALLTVPAQADVLVSFWKIATPGVPTNAIGTPAGPADASFIYTGPLDWSNPGPQNGPGPFDLVGTFLNTGFIANYTSPSGAVGFADVGQFALVSMSASGFNYASFFQISGFYNAAGPVAASVTHDDGFSIYVDGSLLLSNAAPTVAVTDNFVLAGGSHSFVIDYVAANGSPSVFSFAADITTAVPEPSTWAMMILGFAGIGFMTYRRRDRFIAHTA